MADRLAVAPGRDARRLRSYVAAYAMVDAAEWMQQFTVGWLIIQVAVADGRTQDAAMYLAAVASGRLVMASVFGLVGGLLADHIQRRRLLVMTTLLSTAGLLLLALLVATGRAGLLTVVGLAAILAAAYTLDAPARLSIAPDIVQAKTAVAAIGVTRLVKRLIAFTNPLMAGALIVSVGTQGVLLVCAALCVASLIPLAGATKGLALTPQLATGAFGALREAVTYARGNTTMRALLILAALYAFLGGSFAQLLPVVVHETLGAGSVQLSLLAGAWGIGGVLGAAAVTTMDRWHRRGRILTGDAILLGALLVTFGALRDSAPMLFVAAFVGLSAVVFDGTVGTILQLAAPSRLRGRVIGVIFVIYVVCIQAGVVVLSIVGSYVTISMAVALAGVLMLAVGIGMSRAVVIRDGLRLDVRLA